MIELYWREYMKNIKKLTFDDEQINIQKRRVKECLKNDIIYKKYDEITY